MEDIEDSVVASVLTDALTRYMRYLEVEQELHESSQLRQGKGVETSTDLARTEYFHRKTVATESCLLVVGQITENVRRWVTGGEVVKDVGHRKEKQVEFGSQDESLIDLNGELTSLPGRGFQTTREDEDEEPYINPMTGQWITPATSRSAGPSNNQGLYKARSRKPSFDYSLEVDAFQSSPPVKVGETLIPNVLADLKRCTNFRVQPEGEISLLPQTSITPNLLDLDDDNPPPYDILIPGVILPLTNLFVHPMLSSSYPSPTPGSNTLNTSPRETDSATEDTFSDCDYEGQQVAHLQFERVLGDGNLRNTLQLAFSLENSTTRRQFDLDRLAAQNLQTQFDNEVQQSPSSQNQDGYTRQMEQEERIRVLDIDAEMEAARRLASEWEAQDGIYEQGLMYLRGKWEKEDRMLEAQVSFADSLRRSEEARDEAIRRDRAAAMAAQHQWEEEVRESEDSARRLVEEIKREEEEEEEERERMRAAAEAAKRIAEELERQEEEELQRLAAEAAEAERRERQADCVVCMEPSDKVNMCLLSCEHYYCGECIVAAFNTALTSRAPFTCCTRNVPGSIAARFLPAQTMTRYDLLVLELTTANPRYCSHRSCRLFIPPNSVHGPVAVCPSCHTRTCSSCNNAEHAGVCAEDREGTAVVALANRRGWKICPRCRAILERTEGCLHMTCRCGAEWCYSCLGDWRNCRSTCSRA